MNDIFITLRERPWLILAGLGIAIGSIYMARILLVPVVAAVFVAYFFEPAVTLFQRRGMDRGNAFLMLLLLSMAGVGLLAVFVPSWVSTESVSGSGEEFSARFDRQIREGEQWLDERVPAVRSYQLTETISQRAAVFSERFFEHLPGLIGSVFLNLLLVPFIAFFFVRDGRRLKNRIIEMVPNRYFEMSLIMFHRIDEQIGSYLRGRLIESMLVGVTMMVGMGIASLFVPQPQILLIAIMTGVLNLIPYIGGFMAVGISVFLYIGQGMPMISVSVVVLVALVAHLLDNIIIAPIVLSHNVDLHPLTVALVCVVGGEVYGVLGLLIAVPVATTFKVILQEFYRNYQQANGEDDWTARPETAR